MLEEGSNYNIEDKMAGRWITRYRNCLTLEEALERYERLTTSTYWTSRSEGCRIVRYDFQAVVIYPTGQ